MTLLPIVVRELRLAARRKSTFRIRTWTAVLAIFLCLTSMLFLWATSGRQNIGQPLFVNLTAYAFGLCLLGGLFLTADSLTEERREGTLGLLFLTDLHGYDVVLGKLTAALLSGLYALLALIPITGLSLLLGGVTAGEYWRTALALVNALFVSLTSGVWVSSIVRDARQSMGRTLSLLLILSIGLPLLNNSLSLLRHTHVLEMLTWVSPFFPFAFAKQASYFSNPGSFWQSLAASQTLAWFFLFSASLILPHRWQQGTLDAENTRRFLLTGRGRPAHRQKARREFLPLNPILWLVAGEKGFSSAAWLVVLVWVGVIFGLLGSGSQIFKAYTQYSKLASSFGFVLKTLFVAQVCRFFVEARRNGTLEMLLCTPLTNREIIRGQALAIRRTFLWPLVTFLLLFLVPLLHQAISSFYAFHGQQFAVASVFGLASGAIKAVRTAADFLALFWFGLWTALTLKKPNYAPAVTLLAVQILPSVLCWLDIFVDLFFIFLGVTKLQQDLRWVIATQFRGGTSMMTPVVSKPVRVPPVIPQNST